MLKDFINSLRFKALKRKIASSKYEIEDSDDSEKSLLVDLGESGSVMASLDKSNMILFEATIIFDVPLLNLKTYSSIAHTAYYYKFSISGVSRNSNSQVKFFLTRYDNPSNINDIDAILDDCEKCIGTITKYLNYRVQQFDNFDTYDLSMFDDVDVVAFNPKEMGEKKEFTYETWSELYKDIVGQADDYLSLNMVSLHECVKACQEFEEKNKALLAEVGDQVMNELIWLIQLREQAKKDKFSIN